MNLGRAAIMMTVGFIVVTMLISGPLVADVDLVTDRGEGVLFEKGLDDQATVAIVDEPTGPVILEHSGPLGGYRLQVPPVTVKVTEVRGAPRLSYHLRILGMNYIRLTSYFLNESWDGQVRMLEIPEITLNESRVSEQEYQGDVTVSVHGTEGTTVIYESNVTVVVRE